MTQHKRDHLDRLVDYLDAKSEARLQAYLRSPEYLAHERAVEEHVRTHGDNCKQCD